MKIVGIIQCRTGSKRLPKKALLPLAGKPMLWRYIERVKRAKMLDEIVLATTEKEEDDVLCDIAKTLNIKCFKGSNDNLVDRIYKCAIKHEADVIVRLTADNPLIEPKEIDRAIRYSINNTSSPYMVTNVQSYEHNGYPDGIGCEVYTMELFKWAYDFAWTSWFLEHPHRFFFNKGVVTTINCPEEFAYPKVKLTVDTQKDYKKVSAIYNKFGHNNFHVTDYIKEL